MIFFVTETVNTGEEVKGEVILVNVENKEILHEMKVSDDVSCLVWLQEKPFSENHQNTTSPPHTQVKYVCSATRVLVDNFKCIKVCFHVTIGSCFMNYIRLWFIQTM